MEQRPAQRVEQQVPRALEQLVEQVVQVAPAVLVVQVVQAVQVVRRAGPGKAVVEDLLGYLVHKMVAVQKVAVVH